MLTKEDFRQKIADSVVNYPTIAALYQAGDPRVLQSQEAMAQMLAMMSQQIEIGSMEPFDKVRDSTVLADAALKGMVQVGIPARVRVSLKNPTPDAFSLASGRVMFDSGGRLFTVDTPIVVPAGSTGFAELIQTQTEVVQHTVSASQPFYRIEVVQPEDGSFISGVGLQDSNGTTYAYKPEFTNVMNGEKMFHMECDEYRRLFIVLGFQDVVGYQPLAGEVLNISVSTTSGDVRPAAGSPFALEYTYTQQDSQIQLTMDALLTAGANPTSISTLRELCKYPSIYDSSAVYLGEFDLLVRRNMPGLQFLSIWNESVEESVRGASQDNINRLFVAFVEEDGSERSAVEADILRIIAGADDSYDVLFVDPVILPIEAAVAAEVARIHDAAAVREQIVEKLLEKYGIATPAAKVGMLTPQFKVVYKLLEENIAALQDAGSDFQVTIAPPPSVQLPEHFRYMTADSLTVDVTLANYNNGAFGR